MARLFADAGLICIASLISPYRKDRDACRAMLPDENFIEVRALLETVLVAIVRFSLFPFYIILMWNGDSLSQVFMNMPLELCEQRDAKGLYKLARAGKIKGSFNISSEALVE